MKILLLPLTISLLSIHPLFAQDNMTAKPASAAGDQRLELMPAPTGQLAPEPLPLIPESPEPVRKPSGRAISEPAKEKKSKTEIAADEMQERIHYRQAKTKALQDPALRDEWDRAHQTRTDYERRAALKSYYLKLYGRMARLDPSIKKRIDLEQERSLHRLLQTRIAATEALESDERDDREPLR